MFLSFLANYNIRPCVAQYLWVFYSQLHHIKKENIKFILHKEYLNVFRPSERWELQEAHAKKHFYSPPERDDIESAKCKLFSISEDKEVSPSDRLKKFMSTENTKMRDFLETIDLTDVEAGLLWVNNYTFKKYLNEKKIPVIHNELGALRSPIYKDTFYFDFSGVNGGTEFNRRFEEFLKISDGVELLDVPSLLALIANPVYYPKLLNVFLNKKNPYACGVPLQVSNDTNLIAFNNGWSNIDLMSHAHSIYGLENILIRNHPSEIFKIEHKNYHCGNGGHCFEFLDRVKEVITVNSSVGFEAFLLGKNVKILGENPFKKIIENKEESIRIKAINFAIISYLVPIKYLFDMEYYRFRLKCIDELELYNFGLKSLTSSSE